MKLYIYSIFIALLAAIVAAQNPNSFNVPPGGYSLTAGKPTTFTWSNLSGSKVTLKLRAGSSKALDAGTTIVSGLDNTGSYTWNVPADTVKGDHYAVEILDEDNTNIINYTPLFSIDSTVLTSSEPVVTSTATTGTTQTTQTTQTMQTSGTTETIETTGTTSTISTAPTTVTRSSSEVSSSMEMSNASSSSTSASTSSESASPSTGVAPRMVSSIGSGLLIAIAVVPLL